MKTMSLNPHLIKRWKEWTAKWGDRLLTHFDKWFTSGAGVWQTLIVCSAIVIIEIIWPTLDPHGFVILYALTVYSAVTQPALAHAGAETSEQIRVLEERQNLEIAEIHRGLGELHALVKEIHEIHVHVEPEAAK
jgi:hypothetical protein